MRRHVALNLGLLIPFALTAKQLDLRDARILVEHTPVFLDAVHRGECPQTSDAKINGQVATVVIRAGCGSYGWIADLYVQVTTGSVTTDNGTQSGREIETAELASLRKTLFEARADAVLSPIEALCLLRRITVPDIAPSCRKTTIEREADDAIVSAIDDTCTSGKTETAIVDRYTGAVLDSRTGQAYSSPGLESLRLALLRAHATARLSTEDATSLVESRPVLTALLKRGLLTDTKCLMVSVDPFSNADEIWLQVVGACNEGAAVARISVNDISGAMRAVDSGVNLDSPAILQLRQKLLTEAMARRASAVEEVRRECH